jgi:hypothetical protein
MTRSRNNRMKIDQRLKKEDVNKLPESVLDDFLSEDDDSYISDKKEPYKIDQKYIDSLHDLSDYKKESQDSYDEYEEFDDVNEYDEEEEAISKTSFYRDYEKEEEMEERAKKLGIRHDMYEDKNGALSENKFFDLNKAIREKERIKSEEDKEESKKREKPDWKKFYKSGHDWDEDIEFYSIKSTHSYFNYLGIVLKYIEYKFDHRPAVA